jgi:hypothetical protein
MNAIRAIHPYRHEGLWVFDDETVGLRQEPFVAGADGILDRLAAGIPEASAGFTLLFSAQPFLGFQIECDWQREEFGGRRPGPAEGDGHRRHANDDVAGRVRPGEHRAEAKIVSGAPDNCLLD